MPPKDPKQRQKQNHDAYVKRKNALRSAPEARILVNARLRDTLVARTRRLVDESIATGRYGYKTFTEALEDLMLRGMGTLKGDPVIDELMPYMEWMQTIDRLHRSRREAQGGLNRAKEEINELLAIGARDGAVRVYHLALDAAHAMPPTEWRDWMIKELAKSFPELAKRGMKGVNPSAERRVVQEQPEEERRKVVRWPVTTSEIRAAERRKRARAR